MIMRARQDKQLLGLDGISRSLAECCDLKEVKSIRDKAEAARHYAKAAAMSLKIQNQAAELKLRAERRAGQLLSEMITRGGDRKSKAQPETLKLSDLGIDRNQSSRWQREAAVPERVFEEYIAMANRLSRDITAQGLLRIERTIGCDVESRPHNSTGTRNTDHDNGFENTGVATLQTSSLVEGSMSELLSELSNHQSLVEKVLSPYFDGNNCALRISERRLVLRLLRDSHQLIGELKQLLKQSGAQP